jgi:acetylornithine/N-succinyldiaminopimelate aminotransferase
MGSLYGYMHYEIEPDILTSAKGLGGGMPIGATLTTRSIGESMQPGTHGSTFGGNPMACAVADTVLTVVSDKEFLDEVLRKEKLFVKLLNELNEEKSVFSAIRSEGLWIGCDLINEESSKVIDRCYDNGLILVSAGSNCLRLAPALNINDDDIKEGIEILKQVF